MPSSVDSNVVIGDVVNVTAQRDAFFTDIQLRRTREMVKIPFHRNEFIGEDVVAVSMDPVTKSVSSLYKCLVDKKLTSIPLSEIQFPKRTGEIRAAEDMSQEQDALNCAPNKLVVKTVTGIGSSGASLSSATATDEELMVAASTGSLDEVKVEYIGLEQINNLTVLRKLRCGDEIAFDTNRKNELFGPIWLRVDGADWSCAETSAGSDTPYSLQSSLIESPTLVAGNLGGVRNPAALTSPVITNCPSSSGTAKKISSASTTLDGNGSGVGGGSAHGVNMPALTLSGSSGTTCTTNSASLQPGSNQMFPTSVSKQSVVLPPPRCTPDLASPGLVVSGNLAVGNGNMGNGNITGCSAPTTSASAVLPPAALFSSPTLNNSSSLSAPAASAGSPVLPTTTTTTSSVPSSAKKILAPPPSTRGFPLRPSEQALVNAMQQVELKEQQRAAAQQGQQQQFHLPTTNNCKNGKGNINNGVASGAGGLTITSPHLQSSKGNPMGSTTKAATATMPPVRQMMYGGGDPANLVNGFGEGNPEGGNDGMQEGGQDPNEKEDGSSPEEDEEDGDEDPGGDEPGDEVGKLEMHVGKVTNVGEGDMTIMTIDERQIILDDPVLVKAGLLPGMWVGFAIRDGMYVETDRERLYVMCSTLDDEPPPTHFPRVWGRIKTVTPTGHSFVDPDDAEALAGTGKTEIFIHNDKGRRTNDRGGLVTNDRVVIDVDRSNPHDPSLKGPIFKAIIGDSLTRKEGGTISASMGLKGGKLYTGKDGKLHVKGGIGAEKGKDEKGKGKWNNGIDYQIYIGYIHEMNEDKHHGFVRSKPISSQYPGKEAYLYGKEIERANLEKGDVIAFHCLESRDGKPTVSGRDPIYVLAAHKDEMQQLRFGDNEGFISNESKQGDLFVTNEDLRTSFGKDVFMHQKLAQDGGLQKGDTITFKLFVTEDGRPQVATPIWLKLEPDDTLGERRCRPPPEQPFLPERAERLANPKGGKANTKGWEQWAGKGAAYYRRPRPDGATSIYNSDFFQSKGYGGKFSSKTSGGEFEKGGKGGYDEDDYFGGKWGSKGKSDYGGGKYSDDEGYYGKYGGKYGKYGKKGGGGKYGGGKYSDHENDSYYEGPGSKGEGRGSSYSDYYGKGERYPGKGDRDNYGRSESYGSKDYGGKDYGKSRSSSYYDSYSKDRDEYPKGGYKGKRDYYGKGWDDEDSDGPDLKRRRRDYWDWDDGAYGGGGRENPSSGRSGGSGGGAGGASSSTVMSAPSADGSAEQKRQWFAHVYAQYVESYKQQGHDDQSARNMAQKSLEQYKAQCIQQGIRVD
ncbi:unnamed protein product [Amoebophrya sp. A25]|nr:unnamed protein product [Amoebophrya sp. A25]|eukprot:GSA25T00022361001.1